MVDALESGARPALCIHGAVDWGHVRLFTISYVDGYMCMCDGYVCMCDGYICMSDGYICICDALESGARPSLCTHGALYTWRLLDGSPHDTHTSKVLFVLCVTM
jgi:hypothetical protein